MFFNKRKETEIDDDFDFDDSDDFNLDGGGFNDTSPKSGKRKVVSTVTGSFFTGIKNSLLDPVMHRKVLTESLPGSYASHYDDVSDIASATKSLYNTADQEVRKVATEYRNELKPHVRDWNEKSKSKFSSRVAKIVGTENEDSGPIKNEKTADEAQWDAAANDVFGNVLAKATSDGIQNLTEETTRSNKIEIGLRAQSNEILTGVSNTLNRQSAFSEQVALRWQKKSLEIQFKQYFTARKQLDVQVQQQEYFQSVLPALVTNTSLPDIVKASNSEMAADLIKQKWIGSLTDFSTDGALGKIKESLGKSIKGGATELMKHSPMLSQFMGLFENSDSEFGTTPEQMLLETLGSSLGGMVTNHVVKKSTGKLKEKANASDVDFEKHSENLKLLKHQMPALMARLSEGNTGVAGIDKLIEMSGISDIFTARSKTLSGSMEAELQNQALFDLETQKSITLTIPNLLSEIHSELTTVRSGFGFSPGQEDDKLRMDWTAGRLNTKGRVRKRVEQKVFADRREQTDNVIYEMLGELGFDKDDIVKHGEVRKGDEVLLTSNDLMHLGIALKAASYDKTEFFDIESLAAGSPLIRNEEARANIARFFSEHLGVEQHHDSLGGSTNVLNSKIRYNKETKLSQVKNQNTIQEALAKLRGNGINDDVLKSMVTGGYTDDLIALGVATQTRDGAVVYDPRAAAELEYKERAAASNVPSENFRGFFNNEYGIEDNAIKTLLENERKAKEKQAKEKLKQDTIDAKLEAKRTGQPFNEKSFREKWQDIKNETTDGFKGLKDSFSGSGEVARRAGDVILGEGRTEDITNNVSEKISKVKDKLKTNRSEDLTNPINNTIGKRTNPLAINDRFIDDKDFEGIPKLVFSFYEGMDKAVNNLPDGIIEEETTLFVDNIFKFIETNVNKIAGKRLFEEQARKAGARLQRHTVATSDHEPSADRGTGHKSYFEPIPESNLTPNELIRQQAQVSYDAWEKKRKGPKSLWEAGQQQLLDSYDTWIAGREEKAKLEEEARKAEYDPDEVYKQIIDVNLQTQQRVSDNMLKSYVNNHGYGFGGIENKFFGGEIKSKFGNMIKNFAKGGEVLRNAFQDKLLNKSMKIIDKLKFPTPIMQPANDSDFMSHVAQAAKKEKDLGGEPQMAMLSVGEQVVPNYNGEADDYRAAKASGFWDNIRSGEYQLPGTTEMIESIKELRASIGELGGQGKDYLTEKVGSIEKPSIDIKPREPSILSYQLEELIRLSGHIAINTGSTADDLENNRHAYVTPKGPGRTGGFMSAFKERFKRTETESDGEPKQSGWSKFKSKMSFGKPDTELDEVMSDEPIDESTPEGKKKGLMRRMLGGMFGLSWGTTKLTAKAGWWTTKATTKSSWWMTKKAGKGTAAGARGLFGSTEDTNDVYLIGRDKPIMLARDMAEGMYLSKEDGKPVLRAEDITGAVLDLKGNFVITDGDWNERRVEIRTKEGSQSLFVRGSKAYLGIGFGLTKLTGKGILAGFKLPFKVATIKFNDDINANSAGEIDKDIYVKGDNKPRILARLIGTGIYFDKESLEVTKFVQLAEMVYDKDGNVLINDDDIQKGLITPDGTLISKLAGATLTAGGATFSAGLGISKSLAKITGGIIGGGFNLMTGAGKGLWSKLSGKGFDIDGIGKDALMLQAQAATVDKLETIRILLDERLEEKNDKFNDKDGDGIRDGSYLDQVREKIARKKEKDEAKKKKQEEIDAKKGKKEPNLIDAVAAGIGKFFSTKLLFGAIGGLVAANFGPQIATGVFSGIRSVLPRWLGGYSDEKKEEIKNSGGVFKHMMTSGKGAGDSGGDVQSEPMVDANGRPVTSSDGEEVYNGENKRSTANKLAWGLGGAAVLTRPIKTAKLAFKVPGLVGKGIAALSAKTGLTAKMGLTGLGKRAAIMKGVTAVGKGAMAAKAAVGTLGVKGALVAGAKGLGALALSPIGLGVIAVAATAAIVYGGYKLYKHLTKADNHLTTFRMAQYGFEIKESKDVVKLLNLEQYLDNFIVKATTSTSAKITKQANLTEVLKIFDINPKSEEEVDTFFDWYYFRFKPVYLTWKTLYQRAENRDDLKTIDQMLLMGAKLDMMDKADFYREQENPYDVPMSPFPGVDALSVDHDSVLAIKEVVVRKLSKIDVDKHDAKVRTAGGGRSEKKEASLESITEMTGSGTTKLVTDKARIDQEKREELKEAQKYRKQNEMQERKEKQSYFNKLMFGDKNKAKDDKWNMFEMGKKAGDAVKGWFAGSGDGGGGGTYDASSKTLNLTAQDVEDITKVTSTEVAGHLPLDEYNKQAGAIVDTIINRAVTGKKQLGGGTIRGVINQHRQFSKITGPASIKPYGSIQNMPLSAANARVRQFVPNYLAGRVDGTIKPLINGDLNYLNPDHSDASNLRSWGNDVVAQAKKSGQVYGTGGSKHYHGTTKDNQNVKPFGFKLAMNGKTSSSQGTGGGKSKTTASNGILGGSGIPSSSKGGGSSNANANTGSVTTKAQNKPGPWAPGTQGVKSFDEALTTSKDKVAARPGSGVLLNSPAPEPEKTGGFVNGVKAVGSKIVQTHKEIGSAMSAPAQGSGADIVKAAKADGNLVANKMTKSARPYKAGEIVTKRSLKDSTGWCARYVREALQKAGYKIPGGLASAYMYHTTGQLAKYGFTQIPAKSKPQVGDVMVINKNPKSKKHGHICIFNGTQWVSDYRQSGGANGANPYSVTPEMWLYRDSQFLDGASTLGVGAVDGEFDSSGGESSAPQGPPRYQLNFEKANKRLEEKKAKREEFETKNKTKYVSREIGEIKYSKDNVGAAVKPTKADTTSVKSKSGYDSETANIKFNIPKSPIVGWDMEREVYEPKERISTVKVEDSGATPIDSSNVRKSTDQLRNEAIEANKAQDIAAHNAQLLREKLEKSNQEALGRLDKKHADEVTTAKEQKAVQEKQQKIAEEDNSILQRQLDVQTSMAKDMRRMAETLDKMYAMPSVVSAATSAQPPPEEKRTIKPSEQNSHTRTIATMEPMSMKIN